MFQVFSLSSSSNSGHLISYLLFLSGGWFSSEDARIHGLNVLYHHAKHLVAEIKHQLREKGGIQQGQSKDEMF